MTVTFTYGKLDKDGNTTGDTVEYPDETGNWSHYHCDTCNTTFGIDVDAIASDNYEEGE